MTRKPLSSVLRSTLFLITGPLVQSACEGDLPTASDSVPPVAPAFSASSQAPFVTWHQGFEHGTSG